MFTPENNEEDAMLSLQARQSVVRVFVGSIEPLPSSRRPSAIRKTAYHQRIALDIEGLEFDHHADKKRHGGPDKALLYYPDEHYTQLIDSFDSKVPLEGGALGENISAWGWVESEVHIGDVFQVGTARIQVTQPRELCWKIDDTLGVGGVAKYLSKKGMTGWYFRVLMTGHIGEGDTMQLTRRMQGSVSVAKLWRELFTTRPDLKTLQSFLLLDGLSNEWHGKITDRVRQLVAAAHGLPTG